MSERRRVRLSPTQQRLLFYGGLAALITAGTLFMTRMPGHTHTGPVPPPSALEAEAARQLERHVRVLAHDIGERRIGEGDSLAHAHDYIRGKLLPLIGTDRETLTFENLGPAGSEAQNIVLELHGESPARVIVGAHYDSAPGTPGANDNASGVAAALMLAEHFAGRPLGNTLRVVFFANEEPPYFQNDGMGSLHHAQACAQRGDQVLAMLSLESLGYYSDAPGSQHYPGKLVGLAYPDQGNFVAFVGNLGSRSLVRHAIEVFRRTAAVPSEGAALPSWIPGVDWSDHSSFWKFGYPAIMVTDTAVFRDEHYHQFDDTPEHLSYTTLARVVLGLEHVIEDLTAAR